MFCGLPIVDRRRMVNTIVCHRWKTAVERMRRILSQRMMVRMGRFRFGIRRFSQSVSLKTRVDHRLSFARWMNQLREKQKSRPKLVRVNLLDCSQVWRVVGVAGLTGCYGRWISAMDLRRRHSTDYYSNRVGRIDLHLFLLLDRHFLVPVRCARAREYSLGCYRWKRFLSIDESPSTYRTASKYGCRSACKAEMRWSGS